MRMYRPADQGQRQPQPRVVVSIESEPSGTLGEWAEELHKQYAPESTAVITVDDWPVAMKQASVGDECVAVKGALRITVLVKHGDHGPRSQEGALPYLHLLLAKLMLRRSALLPGLRDAQDALARLQPDAHHHRDPEVDRDFVALFPGARLRGGAHGAFIDGRQACFPIFPDPGAAQVPS